MKKKIKNVLAVVIFIMGIVISCWLAINVMLVGGIQQTITGFQNGDAGMAAWGLARALLSEFGFVPFWIGFIISAALTD